MARKTDKIRPYRVDWFDVNEMIDNDKVLVRSVVIRAVTAKQAATSVEEIRTIERNSPVVVIRAHRFYKKLLKHRKDVYKAVEDLFTAKQAAELMELIEEYRRKKIDEQFAAAAWKMPADPLADVVGGVRRSAVISIPCGTSEIASRNDYADPDAPTTGPDSPATQAVVADLQGMVDHDAHEQLMDKVVVNSTDAIGRRFPQANNTHTPFLTSCPACGGGTCKGAYGQPTAEHGDDIAAALTAVDVGPTPPPDRICGDRQDMPLSVKITLFGIIGFFAIVIVIAILHNG